MKHKRKKHSKVSGTRRRRSHSGMGAIDTTNILGVIAGAVVAGYLNKIVPATVNDKLLAGGKVGLGIALPMIFKSGKTKNIMSGVGAGMIAVGSVDLLKSFGALSGDFDIPIINGDTDELGADVLGYSDEMGADLPIVNGDADELGLDVLGMDDEALSGDED